MQHIRSRVKLNDWLTDCPE